MAIPPTPPRRSALAGALAFLLAAATPAAPQSGAFAPGTRWESVPDPADPWLPAAVATAGGGELVWASTGPGSSRLALYAAGVLGPAQPVRVTDAWAGALGPVEVAGGAAPDALFAVARLPDTASGWERSVVARFDPFANLAPLWQDELGTSGGTPRLGVDDAGTALAVARTPAPGVVRVDWLDARTGSALACVDLDAPPPRILAVSDGAREVALVAGDELFLLRRDGADVTTLRHLALAAPGHALALSADGATLAVGDGDRLSVRAEALAWGELLALAGGPGELPLRADLDAAGERVAVAFWDAWSAAAVRVAVHGPLSGTPLPLLEWSQSSAPGDPQNYAQALELSRDGARLAIGTWGTDGAEPEALLLAVADGEQLLAADLGGSLRGLDLDATGTRVAVAAKDGHAGVLSGTGSVRLLDTGGRDLQVVGDPHAGGTLELRLAAGGGSAGLVLFGTAGAPLVVPGVAGPLLLDPGEPWHLFAVAPLAPGELGARFPVPPALVGTPFQVQGLVWEPAGPALTAALVTPVLLD